MKHILSILIFSFIVFGQTKVEDIQTTPGGVQAFTLENGMKIIQFRMQGYLSSVVFFVICLSDLPILKKYLNFGWLTDSINVNSVS